MVAMDDPVIAVLVIIETTLVKQGLNMLLNDLRLFVVPFGLC
jgi:putative effector of murein hydrolase LrgA (UPF0299 family)